MIKKLGLRRLAILSFLAILIFPLIISLTSARPIDCNIDKPFALWKFNEGEGYSVNDSCYGANANMYGSNIHFENGKYGTAIKLNGVDDYVNAGDFFNQTMTQFSFSLWVNMTNKIAYQTLFQSGNYYTDEYLEALQINEGDNSYAVFMASNSIGIKNIDDSNWHNIIGTFDGNTGYSTLYIDGVFISNYSTGYSQISATLNNLYFGLNYDNGFPLEGSLDDIAFFNRTLAPSEVTSIYNEIYPLNFTCADNNVIALWHFDEGIGNTATDSCHNIQGIIYGTNKTWIDGRFGKSILFNGYDTFVDITNKINQSFNDFSIFAWVKSNGRDSDYETFVAREIPDRDFHWNFALAKDSINNGYPDVSYFDIDDVFINQYVLGTYSYPQYNLTDGNWHLLIGTFNSADQNMTFYFDGNLVESSIIGTSSIPESPYYFLFGTSFRSDIIDYGYFLNGSLDDVTLFNRTLTSREIADYYNNLIIPSNFTCYDNLVPQLIVPAYPYVDFNINYPMQYYFYLNNTPKYIGNLKIDIKELDNSISTFNLNWNYLTSAYDLTLLFSQIGDYPFTIYSSSCSNVVNGSGTFKVRNPFFVTVRLFNQNDLSSIAGSSSYVTAEFANFKTNNNAETFLNPLIFNPFKPQVFHGTYSGGQAVLKLYEPNKDYIFRYFSGNAQFSGQYGNYNITKLFGENIYLGTETLNGTTTGYDFYLSSKDLHPYRWLANWVMIIAIIGGIALSVFLLFMIPQYPALALVLFIFSTIGVTAIRIFVWFVFGW